ncbi:MAG TPA: GNAT family N-acetyltransferase [Zoogloea sp.]|nr:GNAT family N-acetyltransferase [Zoogloea sp.]
MKDVLASANPRLTADISRADCLVRAATGRPEWDSLFARVEAPSIVQSWAYGEAKAACGGWCVERLVFERSGEPLAICQVLVKRVLGLPVAARINRGPMFLGASPAIADVKAVYGALRRRWRFGRRGMLVIAPGLAESDEHRAALRAAGFRARGVAGWCSAVLDLRLDDGTLRKRLSSNWRNHLNGAERGGLVFDLSTDEAAVEWIFARHGEHMRGKGFSGTPVDFLRALRREAPEDFFVCRALLDGNPVAGMIAFRFGRSAEYFVGWYGAEARRAKAGNFLLWHAARAMRLHGCERFDLGGYSSSDGYGRFKQDMRGSEYRLIEEWVAF